MTLICPTCKWPIPAELIAAERNRELASRPRPGMQGKPSRNPYGRGGKPKRKPKAKTGEGK